MVHVIQQPVSSRQQASLHFRTWLQDKFYETGHFIQKHAGKVLFVGILALVASCAALKSAAIETSVERLWVEEDGRLEKELNYMKSTLGEGIGSTNQLLIQTPKDVNANILHANALLYHLEVMKAASEITVDLFEVTWRLKDVCLTPSIPSFEEAHIEKIFDHLFPCAIISPLDCFWEGSKILGPEYPTTVPGFNLNVKWTNLNPHVMVSSLRNLEGDSSPTFPFASFQEIMKRAGITSAYQEKPCLNPNDTECPITAPNKGRAAPDIGAELTGGCYGFATKYMHWPEDLIVGGAKKNRTGHIVKANAIQSVIQLMGEQEMFDFWAKDYKVHNIDWSLEKAKNVLEAWQRKFSQEISMLVGINERGSDAVDVLPNSKHYSISLFTSTLLDDIMQNFSHVNHIKILIGLLIICFYVAIVCSNRSDPHGWLVGLAGVGLVALSIVSALGICALLRLPLNAATTQVTPFFALGYGVYLLFLLVNTFTANKSSDNRCDDATGKVLQQVGPIILLVAACGILGFLSSAIIPIPALRAFVLQFAIILAVVTASLLLLFPAVESLDLRRRSSTQTGFFCFKVGTTDEFRRQNGASISSHLSASSSSPSVNRHHVKLNNERMPAAKASSLKGNRFNSNSLSKKCFAHSLYDQEARNHNRSDCICFKSTTDEETDETDVEDQNSPTVESQSLYCNNGSPESQSTINYLMRRMYEIILLKKPVKGVVILLFILLFAVCLTGMPKVKDGLELTDIVPRGTVEHKFLDIQRKYFSFYHMFAVTEGNFEYPTNQKLLHEYQHSFTRIGKIIKNDDGGLPDFWLTTFRDWLSNLQSAYDRDAAAGLISQEGWLKNASDEGILAFKLLVQTGRNDYPIDKSLVNKVKLVDSSGIINPKAFYTYLTAWVSNDALAYYASQANFRPEPREWIHVPTDYELKIPKSQPLIYTQIPFYLNRMRTTEEITETIIEIRSICQKYEERGLPNFPHGIPFTFWEQYVRLPLYLISAGIVVTALVFLVIFVTLFSAWTATLIVALEAAIVAQLYGLMGIFEIPLSALPAVILIISVGTGTIFFLPLTVSFLSILGKRNHRMLLSLQHMMPPTVHGIVSTMLGVGMLAFSEFDFIVKYFFYVLCGFMAFGSLYGLVLLPILLSMIGPPTEIAPIDRRSRISPAAASPDVRRKIRKIKALPSHYFSRREFPRVQSDISLSVIQEESESMRSHHQSTHEVVVQPEFVVETTITNPPLRTHSRNFSPSLIDDPKSHVDSPFPASDSESPESPISRDSPMSDSSSGASTMSRPNSAPGSVHGISNHYSQPQTVTTKVTTTAKLKVELHAPYFDSRAESSTSSLNTSRPRVNNDLKSKKINR